MLIFVASAIVYMFGLHLKWCLEKSSYYLFRELGEDSLLLPVFLEYYTKAQGLGLHLQNAFLLGLVAEAVNLNYLGEA